MRCYAERGYATEYCLPVRPSVRPCVTFRYRDHIGWNSSKIISRPNSLRPICGLTPTWASWYNGNTPKIWSGIRVGSLGSAKTYNVSETVQDSPDQGYYDGLIGSRIRAFDWYQNQRPSTTLNGVSRDGAKFVKCPLLSQERVKLRTSNLAGIFTGSIRTKAH